MTTFWLLVALLATPGPDAGLDAPAGDGTRADVDAEAEPAVPADPLALWDAARTALDLRRDPATARPLLERLVAEFPDSRPADRAMATLARIDALGDAAAAAWALPREAEAAFVADRPDARLAPLVAIRHSTTLPEPEALALLERHRNNRRWGWAVDREIGRRLYEEGHFIDAWQAADAAGDTGRVRASMRMIAWRAAPFVGVLLIAVGLWWVRRRRRRADGPADGSQTAG